MPRLSGFQESIYTDVLSIGRANPTGMSSRTRAGTIAVLVAVSAVVVGIAPIADGAAADAPALRGGPPTRASPALRGGPPAQTNRSVAAIAPRGRWNPTTSTGEIILDSRSYYTVFRGERDVTRWRRASDDGDVSGRTLVGEGGAAEGTVLSLDRSIPDDQPTGRYAGDQLTATVVAPRITSMDVINPNGVELGDGASVGETQRLLVAVRWNYVGAEDVQVDLVRDGVFYEREALSTAATPAQVARLPDGFGTDRLAREVQGPGATGYGAAFWLFDFGDLAAGTYTLRAEGVDDLTSGSAARTVTVRVGSDGSPRLALDRPSATRGAEVRYTITGSEAGRFHAVSIDRDRLRNADVDPARVFRRVGDVVTTGNTSDAAYAVVEVPESGVAVGTVDTALLDTGTTRLTLHAARPTAAEAAATVSGSSGGNRTASLDVRRGTFATNVGTFEYVVGSRIDVRGTADGPDYVALYVRDRGDWELLTLDGEARTRVGPDGVWEAEDVRLSEEGPGGRLLSLPGSYRLAVVDADGFAGSPPARLSTTELNRLTNYQTTVRAVAPGATYIVRVGSVGGELAEGDTLTVRGVAPGARDVAMVFVDERGRVATEVAPVARDNTFEERVRLDDLGRGRVTAIVAVPGRDGVFGTGSVRGPDGTTTTLDSARAFAQYADTLGDRGLTGEQVVVRIDGDVLRATASDDLVSRQTFRIAAPRTEVRDVVPASAPNATGVRPVAAGETTLVRGRTNRNPRDATIVVEVVDDGDVVTDATVRAWGGDGAWTATLALPADLRPGTYTLRTDDGENTVTREIEVRGRAATGTPTEVPTTRSPTGTPPTTAAPTTATATATPSPTAGGGPGFGPVVALAAVLLVALAGLATRRRG